MHLTTPFDRFPTSPMCGDYFLGRYYRLVDVQLVFMVAACNILGDGSQSIRLWFPQPDTHVYVSVQWFWYMRDSGAIEDC
jgi:hypothetical protein